MRAIIGEKIGGGEAQVLTSELMGHFRPVFAGFNPVLARAHASRGFFNSF